MTGRVDVDGELDRIRRERKAREEKANGAGHTSAPPNEPKGEGATEQCEVRLEDFVAYMPMHSYIFTPTREMWPASSVNARIKPIPQETGKAISASAWLDVGAPVEQMTWAPGLPMLIQGRLVSEGGWIDRPGCTVFNLYRPPALVPVNAAGATPWLEHVHHVYPNEADHIVRWLAQRVQRPQEKINHALVLGGLQGIGKDTLTSLL
jgi:hypothetical protein